MISVLLYTNATALFSLKLYFQNNFDIELHPDEAYLFENENKTYILKILEQRNQNTEGSVELKMMSGTEVKKEYELLLGSNFEVEYAFCISEFLENKYKSDKQIYKIRKQILDENNIVLLYGDSENYFEKLDEIIKTFLCFNYTFI